jgi:monoamine oxidase
VVTYLYNQLTSKGGKVVLNAPVTVIAYSSTTRVTVRPRPACCAAPVCRAVLCSSLSCTPPHSRPASFHTLHSPNHSRTSPLTPHPHKQVTTQTGATYNGKFAVVTLPVGVLNAKKVVFRPSLPSAKTSAISKLGMGTLNKVVLQFPDAATSNWDKAEWIDRYPLPADGGKWREFYNLKKAINKPVMVAFNAGDPALYPATTSDATLVSDAVTAMRQLYGAAALPDPVASWVTRWHTDPWTLGSYSVYAPGATGKERTTYAQPTSKLLYWAGEGTSKLYAATVQGAWVSGADAATAAARDNP